MIISGFFVGGYWTERYFTGESEIKCRKILNFIWRIGDEFLPLRRVLVWVGNRGGSPGEDAVLGYGFESRARRDAGMRSIIHWFWFDKAAGEAGSCRSDRHRGPSTINRKDYRDGELQDKAEFEAAEFGRSDGHKGPFRDKAVCCDTGRGERGDICR